MTEEYLTDDEQLEAVKRWTAENGPWLVGGLVLGLAGLFGYRYYNNHQNERALGAAAQFSDMAAALQHNDATKARQIADGLIKEYPSSPYADQAQLTIARLYVEQGQDANAIPPLTQVMDNSKDAELKHIARLRLARVLIDQGKPDEALNTLSGPAGAFSARYHDVRGDAFVAKKDLQQAVAEYKAALAEGAAGGSADSALVALKIADLGLPAASAAAAPIASATLAAPAAPGTTVSPPASPNKAKP